jgi:hypothetical protein
MPSKILNLYSVSLFLGIVFVSVALFVAVEDYRFTSSAERTSGVVVELRERFSRSSETRSRSVTYAPVVDYQIAGEQFRIVSSTSSNPPAYAVGDRVPVLFRSESPGDARIASSLPVPLFSLIFGGAGLVPLAIAGVVALRRRSRRFRGERLSVVGTKIVGDSVRVEHNLSLNVNGQSPYQIVVQWRNPRTDEVHLFTSENFWFDPSSYIADTEIPVFIDPLKPSDYHIDTSALPRVAK